MNKIKRQEKKRRNQRLLKRPELVYKEQKLILYSPGSLKFKSWASSDLVLVWPLRFQQDPCGSLAWVQKAGQESLSTWSAFIGMLSHFSGQSLLIHSSLYDHTLKALALWFQGQHEF